MTLIGFDPDKYL